MPHPSLRREDVEEWEDETMGELDFTGRRVLIDNGQVGNIWTWEADNLYAMTVGGDWLWLRQDFRGTHVLNLADSRAHDAMMLESV